MKTSPGFRVSGFGFVVIALAFILLVVPALRAEIAYPQRAKGRVNDFAGILAETDRKTMGEMLNNLKDSSGIDMELVTVKSVEDYGGQGTDIDSFAEGLLNAWGIGAQGGKGIIMLVSTGDRRIKIETSGAFGPEYDDLLLGIVNKKIIPFFRQSDYSRGIYEGVREIIKQLSQKKTFPELYGNYAAGAAVALVFIIALVILSSRRRPDNAAKPHKKEKPRVKARQGTTAEVFGGGASGGW
jgi:uncharacterized membrane protein YgcG